MSEFMVSIPDVILTPDNRHPDIMNTIDKKERQKEYFKNWYEKRVKKEGLRADCECGTNVAYMNLCNHRKTKKHARLMKAKEDQQHI